MHAAEQNLWAANLSVGNGQIRLLCGRVTSTRFLNPHDGPNNDGNVYACWPNYGADSGAMQTIVNDGVGGHLYSLSQGQAHFFRKMWQITKIGSSADVNGRLSQYCVAQCVVKSFFVDAARSVQQRPDERRRQSEILGFLANAPPGSRPATNDRHISGEWMRCTPQEREQVRVRTHAAAHNHGLGTRQGIYERGEFNLEVYPAQLNYFQQWGLVTNDEVARNNNHFRDNLVYYV